ncbi:MAG: hypothetical protein ACW99A_03200 [Candidatus Kariarchaeaceae archaeon]|jgi:hypothetical protein
MIKTKYTEERRSKTPHKVVWGFLIIFIMLILSTFISNPVVGQNEMKLIPSDGEIGDNVGYSVALTDDGVLALIGAPGHNTVGDGSGAVYIFSRDGTVWGTDEDYSRGASDGMPDDQYGYSVAIAADGGSALIGTPYHSHPLIDGPTDSGSPGSAYVLKYDPDAMSWREERELYGYSDNDDLFGSSVAISGDGTALVGAPGDESIYGSGDEQISIKSGSASVFIEFGGPAPWTFLANLFPSDPIADGLFGQSVAISRDRSIDSM